MVSAVLLAAAALAAATPAPVHLARMLADERPPGAQILLLDRGRVVDEHNVGLADLATRRPVDAHTRFEIGSVTKQFTAAAIVQLAERKQLTLSDPLGRWVPQYRPGRRITLEQLLWQVSGIPDYTYTHAYWKTIAKRGGRGVFLKRLDLNGELALIAGQPLRFRPGSAWEYSNTNYALLGAVVAKASGMPWKRYVRTHLLEPAGMTESGFAGEAVPGGALATGYALARGTLKPIPVDNDVIEGDGGIVSTAHDLARWNAALFGGRIVSAHGLARMTAPGPRPQGRQGYGFGIQIDTYDGVRRLSHGGGSLGYTAADHVYPSLGEEIIVLTNAGYAGGNDLADAEFDDRHPRLFASGNAGVAGEDPAITALLKRLWFGMVHGHVDQSLLEPRMGRFMANRQAQRDNPFAPYGTSARWLYRGATVRDRSATVYAYRLLFANGRALDLNVAVSKRRKVDGIVYFRR
jgi:D-alanyl-D-alanine carboxypeptidase